MNAIRRILVGLFALATAITFNVLVMQYGWGLEPRSWGWIIGVGLSGNMVAQILFEVAKSKRN